MTITILIISFLLFSTDLSSQKITKDQAQNDLTFLKKSIVQYNPALDIYNPNSKMKSEELIKSVKEEEGFAAGSKQYIDLPNSNIRIGIPHYHIYFSSSKKQTTTNRGLLPDYEVTSSISDVLDDKDIVLEKALSLIK